MDSKIFPQGLEQLMKNLAVVADTLPSTIVVHEVSTLKLLYMNRAGLDGIGATLEALQQLGPEEYHAKYMNADDAQDYVPKIMHIIKSRTNEQTSFFQQIRNPAEKAWRLFLSNTRVFYRNELGDATHIITVATQLDPGHHISKKVERLVGEVEFFREHTRLFLQLTRRERQILGCMARGMNSGEIAEQLYISMATADTHRKNIRSKLGLQNHYDAVKFAQAYHLI